jgi:hypothetical protein
MKYSTALVAVGAAIVAAQDISSLPDCGVRVCLLEREASHWCLTRRALRAKSKTLDALLDRSTRLKHG